MVIVFHTQMLCWQMSFRYFWFKESFFEVDPANENNDVKTIHQNEEVLYKLTFYVVNVFTTGSILDTVDGFSRDEA